MFRWLRGRFRKSPPPLTGAPAVRRQKTHSAASGYVYQYCYEGRRTAVRGEETGTEYVFLVSAGRKTSFPLSVFVSSDAAGEWERRHGRELRSNEQYAVAKMALFQAFDERPDPAAMREDVRVRPADLDAILESLGLD